MGKVTAVVLLQLEGRQVKAEPGTGALRCKGQSQVRKAQRDGSRLENAPQGNTRGVRAEQMDLRLSGD